MPIGSACLSVRTAAGSALFPGAGVAGVGDAVGDPVGVAGDGTDVGAPAVRGCGAAVHAVATSAAATATVVVIRRGMGVSRATDRFGCHASFVTWNRGARRHRQTFVRIVGRVLVAGSLLAVLASCASGGGDGTLSRSGTVSGVVLSAPSCPVERAGSPCPPRAVPGAEVTASRGGSTVAHVRADGQGRFTMTLAAGGYTITARVIGGIGSSASTQVTVTAGAAASVTLTVDSGIR